MDGSNDILKDLSVKLSKYKILPKANLDLSGINHSNLDSVVDIIINNTGNFTGVHFVGQKEIDDAIGSLSTKKMPAAKAEVANPNGFNPIAAGIKANYKIDNREVDHAEGNVNDFVNYFRSRLSKIRELLINQNSNEYLLLDDFNHLSDMDNKSVYVIGIVYEKFTTKKGNIMVMLEDENTSIKVIFSNNDSPMIKKLFDEASGIIKDEVIGVKGKVVNQFLIAKEIVWPDVPVVERKNINDDIAIAFISDIHVGSKLFLEENFKSMEKWLSGDGNYVNQASRDLAGKIKYIVASGDIVDGIGVYPNQDRDLAIPDMYLQYKRFFDLLDNIPDYIEVFILPGNHDSVRRAEPQPALSGDIIKDFHKDNVHFVTNPAYLNLHGLNILAYHGTSLDSIISSIPNMSYDKPEMPMLELLKRRHLSPIYGGNIIVPSKNDNLVIDKVPDILVMGHVHKNGIAHYKGVTVINDGTWQARTALQVKYGQNPTPCTMPVFEMKTYKITNVDFNGANDGYKAVF